MKAILVINKPRYCEECSLYSYDGDYGYFCPVNRETEYLNTYGEDDPRYETIRKGCPLKEMPQEKEYREIPHSLDLDGMRKSSRDLYLHRLDVDNSYVMGWNECIKEMENGNASSKADELFHDLLSKLLEIEK